MWPPFYISFFNIQLAVNYSHLRFVAISNALLKKYICKTYIELFQSTLSKPSQFHLMHSKVGELAAYAPKSETAVRVPGVSIQFFADKITFFPVPGFNLA